MTLEFLVPPVSDDQYQQDGNMYGQANQSMQPYPTYGYSQTPTTQYLAEYPSSNGQYQPSSTLDVQQPHPHPAVSSWGPSALSTAGLPPMDWGASPDPFAVNSYPSQTPSAPIGTSPFNSEELDIYPGFAATSSTVNSVSQALHRPNNLRSSYQDWMRSSSYRVNPQTGKTRTKDKYRVVYSDHQRLELEKEFHYSRYITIRRKAELAVSLGLSERQVKIWFQNRRAKERKQNKKRAASGGDAVSQANSTPGNLDKKTAIEGEMEKGKGVTITSELCTAGNSPSSATPELLELSRPNQPHDHHRVESGIAMGSTQLPPFGHGPCQLQASHHTAVTASLTLLNDMPQMQLK